MTFLFKFFGKPKCFPPNRSCWIFASSSKWNVWNEECRAKWFQSTKTQSSCRRYYFAYGDGFKLHSYYRFWAKFIASKKKKQNSSALTSPLLMPWNSYEFYFYHFCHSKKSVFSAKFVFGFDTFFLFLLCQIQWISFKCRFYYSDEQIKMFK